MQSTLLLWTAIIAIGACATSSTKRVTNGEAENDGQADSPLRHSPITPTTAIEHVGEGVEGGVIGYRTHSPSPAAEAAEHIRDCSKNVSSACHAAGLDAYYRPSGKKNNREAFHYFSKGCNLGYAASCSGLGVLYSLGKGVSMDAARAYQLYHNACHAGSTAGCRELAESLRNGKGIAKNSESAKRAEARRKCLFDVMLDYPKQLECPKL